MNSNSRDSLIKALQAMQRTIEHLASSTAELHYNTTLRKKIEEQRQSIEAATSQLQSDETIP